MLSVDLNCDMGESFGAFSIGQDVALMSFVSSVNIACGFHGGDPSVMKATVKEAVAKGLAIGAHPGYPDLQGFGRRDMKISPDEVYDIVLYQIGALMGFASAAGTRLHHVKPHGALYNTAVKDQSLSKAIAQAVRDVDQSLLFVGLSGSIMLKEAEGLGLRTVSEVFADRTYQDDGTLTPRTSANALIHDETVAAQHVLRMVQDKKVKSVSGKDIDLQVDSVCIHGDGKNALALAKKIVEVLNQNHVSIRRP
jgi:5-oxoprolinase (ATP-hydrolysing) subunit A